MKDQFFDDDFIDNEDDFDEEAEALERYPFLSVLTNNSTDNKSDSGTSNENASVDNENCGVDSENDGTDNADNTPDISDESEQCAGGSTYQTNNSDHHTDNSTYDGETSTQPDEDENNNLPNYHYIERLTEDLLPGLDFYRYDNLFEARPARSYFAEERPQRQYTRLFGDHWRAGEMAILFGDTGSGKSVLGVQIAQSIASGRQFASFGLDAPAQRVVHFDFELTKAQFESRYSSPDEAHAAQFPFHVNFIRCQPRVESEMPPEFRDYTQWLLSSMIEFIAFSDAQVVIIDNITWLNNSMQVGNAAARIMKVLQKLKKRLDLSILVIAHTPKRPVHWALNINDLQGSGMLATFADSVFALGTSAKGPDLRYVKAIKHRSAAARASETEVAVLRLVKDQCFLGFESVETADESEHIVGPKRFAGPEARRLLRKIIRLHEKGWTQRRISETTGVSAATINRFINSNKGNGFSETQIQI